MSLLATIRRVLEPRPDVRLAYAFGSVARGEADRGSDVDVAVLFGDDPTLHAVDGLIAELEAAVGRTVDLVVLGTASPLLVHEVLSAGQLVLCREEAERVAFEARATARYLDSAHLRAVQHTYLRMRAEAHRARSG